MSISVPILETGLKLIERIFPDKTKQEEARLKLLELQQNGELKALEMDMQLALGQLEVNKAEAANPSLFISGWRPAVGWICVTALGYQFVLRPLLSWAAILNGSPDLAAPDLDMGDLITLLLGMLGLGGLRTAEKFKGVASK